MNKVLRIFRCHDRTFSLVLTWMLAVLDPNFGIQLDESTRLLSRQRVEEDGPNMELTWWDITSGSSLASIRPIKSDGKGFF